MLDEGRKADLKELKRLKRNNPDKATLHNIKGVEKSIRDAAGDSWKSSARASMIREAKRGNMEGARGIQEDVTTRVHKNMGIGKTSFSFNIPKGIFKK